MGKFLIQVDYQSLNPKIHLVYFLHLHILIYYIGIGDFMEVK
jgi:hypothetical protein